MVARDGRGGRSNAQGIAFYKRLLERLKEKGVRTFATVYHWDLPQHLEDRGGWLNRDTAYRFADYADLMSREVSGLVHAWMTLNEPWWGQPFAHRKRRGKGA